MRILFSELPQGTEVGQVLCYVRVNVPLTLVEAILVTPEDQASLLWPDMAERKWVSGPVYKEGPLTAMHPPMGRPIGLWGIAARNRKTAKPQTATEGENQP